MPKNSLARTIKTYLIGFIALSIAATLMVTTLLIDSLPIEIDSLPFHLNAALWCGLLLTILGMIGQISSAEKNVRNYSSQLFASKERLTNEIKHRLWAEKTSSENKVKSQYIDENIPVMLAYFNTDQRCHYHNRIFRRWFGLKPDQIDGHLLEEFSNEEFYSGIKNSIDAVIGGRTMHSERVLKSNKGFPYIFTEQYIPHMDNKGKVVGFYTLITPRAQEKDRSSTKNSVATDTPGSTRTGNQGSDQASKAGITAARIVQAIDGGEFNLYCQKIIPVTPNATALTHQEVLIRMSEEENNLMPPGSFLPFVDQFKMMPKLDRWVLDNIIQWLSSQAATSSKPEQIYCLNIARDTLSDTYFPSFIQTKLKEKNVPARLLCFEIEESDVTSNLESARIFSEEIRKLGCLVTLCSFSNDQASLDLLKKIKVDYLKIDGGLICNILNDDEDLAQVVAIAELAKEMKVKTIAELVETKEIVDKLREIGVDFAQGFHIARPSPLKNIK